MRKGVVFPPSLGDLLDIFRIRQYFDTITEARLLVERARTDAAFVGTLRRALLPLPWEPGARGPVSPFAPLRRRRPPATAPIAVVATGGSGALASLLGVMRAFEEDDLRPASMSFASGAAIFGFPCAAGLSVAEVADFVLAADPSDWVDPDWTALALLAPRLARGFGGILRGDRIEAAFRELLGPAVLGELEVPAYAPVWNVEHNRLEYIGPRTHPRLSVARAIRMAISIPLLVEPARWHGLNWCDGAIVDVFPVRPVLDIEPPPPAVLAVNCFYPPEFAGDDVTGWRQRPLSILEVAAQVRTAQHAELARENLRRLRAEVGEVAVINPVAYDEVRGAGFYAQFLDRRQWPRYMVAGRREAVTALARLRRAAA